MGKSKIFPFTAPISCKTGFILCGGKFGMTPKSQFSVSFLAGAMDEKAELIASWIAENGPPAHVWDLCFGQYGFSSMCLYSGQRGIDVVGCEVDQRFTWLIGWLRRSRKSSTEACPGFERHIVVLLIGYDLPTKHVVVKVADRVWMNGWNFDMCYWMLCHEYCSFQYY